MNSIVKCGIDEVGRGCLAGPVTAAALIFLSEAPEGLRDSKELSEKKRHILETALRDSKAVWAVGWASPTDIDKINIHHASLLAMKRAYLSLVNILEAQKCHLPELALIDGKFPPQIPIPTKCIVSGDCLIPCIQAASIVAKNARDAYMKMQDTQFPVYGFSKNKGYPTLSHRQALTQYGHCVLHRRSFRLCGTS